jgi:hypothetical protein
MATPRSTPPSAQNPAASSAGLATGSGPDLSGSVPAPKSSSRSRAKSPAPEGNSTQGKPAEGLSTAKPVSKARSKSASGKAPKSTGSEATASAAGGSQQGGGVSVTAQQDDAAGVDAGSGLSGGGAMGQAVQSPEPVQAAAVPAGERMSDAERQRRIAERAYHKAKERGFGGDRHLDDWLEAEREHDQGR